MNEMDLVFMKFEATVRRSLTSLLTLIALGTLMGFLGGLWWVLALAAHFRVQLTAVSLLALAAALVFKQWRHAAGASVLVAINVLPVLISLGGAPQTPAGDARITVVGLNVNTFSGDPKRVLAWLQTVDADLVGLTEIDPHWIKALAPLRARWPHWVELPNDGNFGLALLSRRPVIAQRAQRLAGHEVKNIRATVQTPLGPVEVVVMHPPPPLNARWAAMRDEQFEALAAEASQAKTPLLIVGDLNATPWARALDPLLDAGLRHGRVGQGVHPTWPDGWWPLGVPIDHVLVRGLVVTEHRVGPSVGSDHRPIVVTLGRLRPPGDQAHDAAKEEVQ